MKVELEAKFRRVGDEELGATIVVLHSRE